ncbi:citrate/2-methylcitrate synthase [Slackia isoflavoniconvertens]|uniref:citrate synthase (unknown stereospecificity) n=2 Tax=Slackia isoflavoniconvertens TaxID=572010 RepID=A0A369LGM5_9ACTN|nr:citrate/2-methylcitrate synthase [Slackia sp.]RDB58470.1 citrate synthase [Slackia isoflavoniconvertens]
MLMKESLPLYTDFEKCHSIDPCYYTTYDIKRGLRNADGTGVVVGVTNISNVHGYVVSEGDKVPDRGRLSYRGYSISDLVDHAVAENRFGFEETAYLLMAGELPTAEQLKTFNDLIAAQRDLPDGFTANYIMKPPTRDLMNAMSRAVLQLYAFDDEAENRSSEHEIDTAIMLLSRLPRIMVLSYHVMRDKFFGDSMFIHHYIPGQSTAETILSMLRPDRQFTDTEAKTLDIMLMLHAEHGGGNNSTFTCRAVTSADTDPYSAYAAAIGSLKGARHGGANNRTLRMTDDIKQHVADITDEGQVADYLRKIVRKEAYDRTGLIYGMGHAVYTLSDPRAELLHKYAERLVVGTEHEAEFRLLEIIERLAPQLLAEAGKSKDICANVDLYSGCVYSTLGIPRELLTPMFASARMAGWSAHRFEEIVSGKRIMRPAFKKTGHAREYVDIADRK